MLACADDWREEGTADRRTDRRRDLSSNLCFSLSFCPPTMIDSLDRWLRAAGKTVSADAWMRVGDFSKPSASYSDSAIDAKPWSRVASAARENAVNSCSLALSSPLSIPCCNSCELTEGGGGGKGRAQYVSLSFIYLGGIWQERGARTLLRCSLVEIFTRNESPAIAALSLSFLPNPLGWVKNRLRYVGK